MKREPLATKTKNQRPKIKNTYENIKNIFIFLICVFGFLFLIFDLSFARIVDKVVAVVNDEVITQSEVDRLLYPIYLQYKNIYKTEEELYERLDDSRLEILNQLINDRLILCEAKKLEIEVGAKEIDDEIEEVKKGLHQKGMELEDLLRQQNLTPGDLRQRYKEQIMIQKVIDSEIRAKVDVQPSEVSNYYSAHVDEFTEPEQVAVYSILIRLKSKRTPLESRQLADDIHEMLLGGSDFKEFATNYSEGPYRKEGGDLGYVKRGTLLKEIENVIFFLKTGEISDVIETPIGYHIFKVYDRIDEKVLPFEEARQKVLQTLYQKKAEKRFKLWVEKLKSNAYISIK